MYDDARKATPQYKRQRKAREKPKPGTPPPAAPPPAATEGEPSGGDDAALDDPKTDGSGGTPPEAPGSPHPPEPA
jgi:hypothetical protein